MPIIRGRNCFLWIYDTGLIALCTFVAIYWGEVGKASSGIGTLRSVSGCLYSGIAVNMGGGVGPLSAGVGWDWGTFVCSLRVEVRFGD